MGFVRQNSRLSCRWWMDEAMYLTVRKRRIYVSWLLDKRYSRKKRCIFQSRIHPLQGCYGTEEHKGGKSVGEGVRKRGVEKNNSQSESHNMGDEQHGRQLLEGLFETCAFLNSKYTGGNYSNGGQRGMRAILSTCIWSTQAWKNSMSLVVGLDTRAFGAVGESCCSVWKVSRGICSTLYVYVTHKKQGKANGRTQKTLDRWFFGGNRFLCTAQVPGLEER